MPSTLECGIELDDIKLKLVGLPSKKGKEYKNKNGYPP